jgi:hypothetical protein
MRRHRVMERRDIPEQAADDWSDEDDERDLYELANLYPADTGLPVTVWVSPRGRARHDARVKVCRKPGNRMDADDTASVAIRPEPRLIAGRLRAEILGPVEDWIRLNQAVLIDYWDGKISTVGMVQGIKKLPSG